MFVRTNPMQMGKLCMKSTACTWRHRTTSVLHPNTKTLHKPLGNSVLEATLLLSGSTWFPLGVSIQGPPGSPPSRAPPTHHTPSHPHLQLRVQKNSTRRGNRAPASACPALLLRLSLQEPGRCCRLTSGPYCQPEGVAGFLTALQAARYCGRRRESRIAFPGSKKWLSPPAEVLPNKVRNPIRCT